MNLNPHLSLIFNVIWFQICWFACVMIGNKAAIIVLAIVICAYLLVPDLRFEIWLLMGICGLGYGVDLMLISTGVLVNSSAGLLPPLWLSVLWLAFATTVNHSLKSLMNRRVLFLMLALVGGPLCYKLGVELTDMQFGFDPLLSLSVLAVVWLLAAKLILLLYEYWKNHV